MSKSSGKKFKWSLEFNTKPKSDLATPPAFNLSAAQQIKESSASDTDQNQLIMKKSWDVALGPIKGIPMNLLIMYMAGNSISIFPIMMVGMSLIRPLKAIFTTSQTFKSFELIQNITPQKFVFFLGNLINIGLALYKCHSMGLLPTHASDWLAFAEPQSRLEYSDGGLLFT